jgi:phosphatidylinositol alpha 1,6-mannosyltransferase
MRSESIKVVFITMFYPESVGGIARVAYELAQQFATAHETAIICTAERTGFRWYNGILMLGIESTGDQIVRVPVLSTANINTIVGFLNAFRPAVIHAHEPVAVAQLAQIWAQMHAVPFVYTAHVQSKKALAFGGAELSGLLRSEIASSVVRRYLTTFYRNCDAIIALNGHAAQDLTEFGYRGRILSIPNGRFLSRYADCPPSSLADERLVLTFTGYVSVRKNQIYLLDVLAHLPPRYVLRLVGEALDADYGKQFATRIATLGLQGRVEITGQVPSTEVADHLAQTHVFVSASKAEVQSLSVIEALAAGRPLVGLGNETIDELVDESVGYRLSPDASPELFAQAVRRLCERPQAEYEALYQAARRRVAHLDWSNIMEQTASAYQVLHQIKTEEAQHNPLPPVEVLQHQLSLPRKEQWVKAWYQLNKASRQPWFLAGLAMTISMGWKLYERSNQQLARLPRRSLGRVTVAQWLRRSSLSRTMRWPRSGGRDE